MTFEVCLNLDNELMMLIKNVNIHKKVIYDLFGVINIICSIVFGLMQYEYKDKKVNIMDYKIINFNDLISHFIKTRRLILFVI